MAIEKKRLLRFLALSAILIFILITIPKTLGLSRAGFDVADIFKQFLFYGVTGGISMLGIWLLFFYEHTQHDGDEDYGSGLCYSSPGEKPSISFFKRFTQFQLFLLSFIIFNAIGLFTYVNKQASFTGISVLAQQFTEIDSLLFSSFLIPVAENLDFMFVLALGIFIMRYLARKYDWDSATFQGLIFLLIPVGGLFGMANHLLRYSDSEVALLTVIVFWSIGAAITLFTGSFLPFLVMHFANNFYFDLGRFLSSELMMLYAGIGIVILIVLYFVMYNGRLMGDPDL